MPRTRGGRHPWAAWSSPTLWPGALRPGQSDVVALGTDYTPYHFVWNGSSVISGRVGATRVLGQPAMIVAPGRLDIFVRAFDRTIHHIRSTDAGVVEEALGGVASDFPSATVTARPDGTTRRVFVHGQDNRIWSAVSLNDGPWQWEVLAPAGMTDRFAGSPTASTGGTTPTLFVRTTTGNLGQVPPGTVRRLDYTNLGGAIADSPTSLGNGGYAHGQDGTLQFFDGTTWQAKGGRFDWSEHSTRNSTLRGAGRGSDGHRRRRRSLLRVQNVTKRFAGVLTLSSMRNIQSTTDERVGLRGRALMSQPGEGSPARRAVLSGPGSVRDGGPVQDAAGGAGRARLLHLLVDTTFGPGVGVLRTPHAATCSTSARDHRRTLGLRHAERGGESRASSGSAEPSGVPKSLERAYGLFPVLAERLAQSRCDTVRR